MKKINVLYEAIIIILAIISIVLVIFDFVGKISLDSSPYLYIDNAILIIFAIDYFTRLILAKNKKDFFKNNIFDLLSIIPFSAMFSLFRISRLTRLTRIFKLLRLTRLVGLFGKLKNNLTTFLKINGLIYLLYISLAILLIASLTYSYAEGVSFFKALWWAIATVTTVGYGDISPATPAGKIAAVLLMFVGIGFIGMLTSSITNYFTDNTETDKLDVILAELKDLKKENMKLSKQVEDLENKLQENTHIKI